MIVLMGVFNVSGFHFPLCCVIGLLDESLGDEQTAAEGLILPLADAGLKANSFKLTLSLLPTVRLLEKNNNFS